MRTSDKCKANPVKWRQVVSAKKRMRASSCGHAHKSAEVLLEGSGVFAQVVCKADQCADTRHADLRGQPRSDRRDPEEVIPEKLFLTGRPQMSEEGIGSRRRHKQFVLDRIHDLSVLRGTFLEFRLNSSSLLLHGLLLVAQRRLAASAMRARPSGVRLRFFLRFGTFGDAGCTFGGRPAFRGAAVAIDPAAE